MMRATLHAEASGRRFHVEFDGEIVVVSSRDPEPDLARYLLARGITGTITIIDGFTHRPRSIVNIEKAAKVQTIETGTGPKFRRVTYADRSPAGESLTDLERGGTDARRAS